ncbi:hypothetical protein OG288_17960 [Streptomyces tauricus]|uniref:Integral membrane protein n=1 Tax=Streptomyces tauricus TaxID=68274 RepID=A0ABZ1JEK0_9ACTN|nr:hypothetical protein [Streptomyces tauricus]
MARSAWQRLRKLTRTYEQGADSTGITDDEADGRLPDATEPPQESTEEAPHTPQKSSDATLIGVVFLLALLLISSLLALAAAAASGKLELPWGNIITIALGLVGAICLVALTWWVQGTLRRRRSRPTEGNPRAGRTEDDQNSVGTQ